MAGAEMTFPPGYLEADRSGKIVAAVTSILVLSTLFLGLRLWARRLKDIRSDWDDFLLFPCWMLLVGDCACAYLSVHQGGAGRHIAAAIMADPHVLVNRGKLIYAITWISGIANLFSRLSILVLYFKIFRTKTTRLMAWGMTFYLVAFFIAGAVVTGVQCVPASYNWTQFEHPPGRGRVLINQFLYFKLQGLFNAICDLGILILPIPLIYALQQTIARKAGLAIVFASGSVGIIASIIRTASFFYESTTWHTDPTWADVDLIIWTVVETGMYLIAASLVGSRPVFQKLSPMLKSFTSSSSKSGSSWGNWKKLVGRHGSSQDSFTQTLHSERDTIRGGSAGGEKAGSMPPLPDKIMVCNEFKVERQGGHDPESTVSEPSP